MKKTLLSMCTMAAMLFATSCSQEEDFAFVTDGSDANVSFSIELPQIATRADYSDGYSAQTLMVAFYDAADTNVEKTPLLQKTLSFNGGLTTTVNVNLATGKTYDIIFWAQSPNNKTYSISWEKQTMTVDYEAMKANDENNDAFYWFENDLKVSNTINKTIELFRPFAQINLGTSDYADAEAAGLTVNRSAMKAVELPSVLNFANGAVSENVEVNVAANTIPGKTFDGVTAKAEAFPVEPTKYEYLEMNYVLVGKDKTTVNCEFYIYETGATSCLDPHIVVSNVPVQRNYRTNIYGALLTDPANFNVTIIPGYNTPDHAVDYDNTPERLLEKSLADPYTKEITLTEDINWGTNYYTVNHDVIIDMAGYEVVAGGVDTQNYAFQVYNSKAEFKNADIQNGGIGVNNGEVIFHNGENHIVNSRTSRYVFYAVNGSKVVIKDGNFSVNKPGNKYICADKNSEVYVEGGVWGTNNIKPSSPFYVGEGSKIVITGGKFNVDPSKYVPAGYTVEQSGNWWIVSDNSMKFVDLGLSVLWADRNVKANTETEVGQYYSWADTTDPTPEKDDADLSWNWNNYAYYQTDGNDDVTTMAEITKYTAQDGLVRIQGVDDIATIEYGANCHIPTMEQIQELIEKCDWTWDDTKKGCTITGPNGNSIFIPAGGYMRNTNTDKTHGTYCCIWSSDIDTDNLQNALYLESNKANKATASYFRHLGVPVRAVKEK